MKRRTKWILGLSFGIPIILIAGFLLVLKLSSPESDLAPIEVKEIPSAWMQESSDLDEEASAEASVEVTTTDEAKLPEAVVLKPALENMGLPLSGALVMMTGDRPFGEESYQLSLENDDAILRSHGTFRFKALIATITLKFDQVLQLDSWLRPESLSLSFDAPLGLGKEINAEFSDGFAAIRSGNAVDVSAVNLDRAYVLGTFSTYAIIPLLYELRELEGEVSWETLLFGGPPNSGNSEATDRLPETSISRVKDVVIRFDGRELTVSQYAISGDMGTMMLYALGVEMLGLFAGDDEDSMFVYRADYFENGFEIAD